MALGGGRHQLRQPIVVNIEWKPNIVISIAGHTNRGTGVDISGKTLQNWEASTKKSNIKSVMEITFSMLAQTVIAALLVSGKISFHFWLRQES